MDVKTVFGIITGDKILKKMLKDDGTIDKRYVNHGNMSKVTQYLMKKHGLDMVDAVDFVKILANLTGKRNKMMREFSKLMMKDNDDYPEWKYSSVKKSSFNLKDKLQNAREQYEISYKTLSQIVDEFNEISMLFEDDDFEDGKIDKQELEKAAEKATKIMERARGFKVDMDGLTNECKKLKIWLPKKAKKGEYNMNKIEVAKELIKVAKELIATGLHSSAEWEKLYGDLVPSHGKADTYEGELMRALNIIALEYFRNGIIPYGKDSNEYSQKSSTSAAEYLGSFAPPNVKRLIKKISPSVKKQVIESVLKEIESLIEGYVMGREGKYRKNNKDSLRG